MSPLEHPTAEIRPTTEINKDRQPRTQSDSDRVRPCELAEVESDPRTDEELLSAHVAGDGEAFGRLFARHRSRLWAIALRTMQDPEEAADALQEALISAFRRAESFRGEARVTTWLHRVVVNACLDRIRRNRVRATGPLPDDLDRLAELTAPGHVDPSDRLALRQALMDGLAQINPDQRAALVLVDVEGYSVAEAATVLGCAAGTVKSRCARARAKLAQLLVGLHQEKT